LQSDDKRKRRNAKKHLDKMRERGEIWIRIFWENL
jgi:hypothetical protein